MLRDAGLGTSLHHGGAAPTVLGCGAAVRALPALAAAGHETMIIDATVLERNPHLANRVGQVFTFEPRHEAQTTFLDRVHDEFRPRNRVNHPAEQRRGLIAIGGGSVIDAAKLVRLRLDDETTYRSVHRVAMNFGVAMIPDDRRRFTTKLAAIPTSLGTGAEASAVACVHGDHAHPSRRLIAGAALKPDSVVLDPVLTRTLDEAAVREGAAEIMLRVLGSYVGSESRAVPDEAAEHLLARTAGFASVGAATGFDDGCRAGLAAASNEAHTGWALSGRNLYAAKHWYLANELTSSLGGRKVPVTLGLLPPLWNRLLQGDTRLGDAGRLRRLWRIIAERLSLPLDPVEGASAWPLRWGIALPNIADHALRDAAHRCAQTWAGQRPALAGLTADEVYEIYATSFPKAGDSADLLERR